LDEAKRAGLAELVARWAPAEKIAAIKALTDLAIPELTGPGPAREAGRAELLAGASQLLKVGHRLEHAAGELAVQADKHRSSSGGAGAATWLTRHNLLTRAQAASVVMRAKALAKQPELRQAALAGRINGFQSAKAARVLKQLASTGLDAGQLGEARQLMVSLTADLDSAGIARAGRYLLEKVAPESTQRKDAEQAEREYRAAHANRMLWFVDHADGATTIQATMPTLDAELVRRMVDAHAEQLRRSQTDADLRTDPADRAALRVDGLLAVFDHAARAATAPKTGGDRPRVQITMSYQDLKDQAQAAKLIGPDQTIAAGELRRMLCDAEILPVVLGTDSEILDVGRANRLVTTPIRAALELRDGGCTFPSCDMPPGLTEAHHVRTWADGGPTGLDNLTLACRHHHGLIEPPRHGPPDWVIRFREDGLPEYIPPAALDPERKPLLHQRFILRGAKPSNSRDPAGPGDPGDPADPSDPAGPGDPGDAS
jgi:hypothetical protein